MAIDSGLRAAVDAWIADDPDPADRAELTALLDRAGGAAEAAREAAAQLRDRFGGRLVFGTAGLRGPTGAGPNRMNRAVVRAATSAVAGWLLSSGGETPGTPRYAPGGSVSRGTPPGPMAAAPGEPPGAAVPGGSGVVVGCDARHRSDEFADESAGVLAAAGIRVHLLPRPCPTPLVAFAVRHLAAQAGIMITASHNPRSDNGYKLYLSDGAQVIPPVDAEIEGRVAGLGPLSAIGVAPLDSPLIIRHGDEIAGAYLDAITGLPGTGAAGDLAAHGPRVVYTPLHGVAGPLFLRAVSRAGFSKPHVVTVQAQPDPDFPTAAFPNPEEPAALALALADAKALDADLVLASDPDGDRLAVAVPEPGARRRPRGEPGASAVPDGRWRVLTGDQVGALLGAWLLGAWVPATAAPVPPAVPGAGDATGPREPLVATTIVSSTLLSKIAARAGARYAETLTGFKWIARAADDDPRSRFVFGYEEAIGYAVGDVVRDKDGIGAAIAFLRLAADAAAAGQSVLDRYDQLERDHGVHLTSQLSLPVRAAAEVMRGLRAAPPATLGGRCVGAVTDYAAPPATPAPGTGLPGADVLGFRLGGDRVVIRPSGTEPKVKAYLEVVEPVAPGGLAAARLAAARRMAPLREAVSALLSAMPTVAGRRRADGT